MKSFKIPKWGGTLLLILLSFISVVAATDRQSIPPDSPPVEYQQHFDATPAMHYIVEFELSQSHFTLDIWEHIKDAANTTTFEIPVDPEFYKRVHPGQELLDDFRIGSLLLNGSFGDWKIKIKSKRTQPVAYFQRGTVPYKV